MDLHEPVAERGGKISASAKRAQDSVAAGADSPTPRRALGRFAQIYINWSASNVREHQLELAKVSVGAARLAAEQSAAQVGVESAIGRDSVWNAGEVISMSKGAGKASSYWVIVSDEKTHGSGEYRDLPSQVHVSYARVKHVASGWVVNAWEPQD